MAVVNHVRKNVKMDLWSIVKFQLAMHCHLKALNVSDQDLSCLTFLALSGEKELTEFCNDLIVKNGKNRKTINLNPDLKIQINGNILLDYKVLHVESKENIVAV